MALTKKAGTHLINLRPPTPPHIEKSLGSDSDSDSEKRAPRQHVSDAAAHPARAFCTRDMHPVLLVGREEARCAANSHSCASVDSSPPPLSNTIAPEDVLDILANSTAARHPANAPAASQPRANESAASRFVRSVGLDRASSTPSRELAESERLAQYQRQVFRRWQPGDVYAPHDLSGTEQKKWKQGRKKPQEDAFDVLGVNPVMEYKVRRECTRQVDDG